MSEGARASWHARAAGIVCLLFAGCFDPDLSSDIPCAPSDDPCPGSMECIDGYCRAGNGSADEFDAKPDSDDAAVIDASAPLDGAVSRLDAGTFTPDAASARRCDPLTAAECAAPATRCAFIATSADEPFEGYFGCVEPSGDREIGDDCDYEQPAGGGAHDNCRSGLLCGQGRACQQICELGQDDGCNSNPSMCEAPLLIQDDVSPLGLCAFGP